MPADPVRLKNRRRDPGSSLACQIEALAGNKAVVTVKRERPWASITFAGTRHSLSIERTGVTDPAALENLATALPAHEFSIPGHFIADILITEQSETHLLVEALSIIDPIEGSEV